ncbi:NUDIX hydrolase [Candidatus Acetothermia bacterium]|nr:NUDIX hydrolase [Candidatus Acetothermia bacterium]
MIRAKRLIVKSKPESVVSSKSVFEGRTIRLRVDELELPNHQIVQREIVEHPGATAIVALVTESSDQRNTKVVLVRQYRHAAGESLWEIPAGTLEPGEGPLGCAQRELLEETGLEAKDWLHLVDFYTAPGFCSENMRLFLARSISSATSKPDRLPMDEFIDVGYFSLAEAREMIRRGQIKDAKSLVGLLVLEGRLL